MLLNVISIFGVLICGSFAGFFRKVVFQILGVGLHGKHHPFEKPWFTTFQTTMGCALSLAVHALSKRLTDRKGRKAALGKCGSGETVHGVDGDVVTAGDIHQPLLYSHEDSRRRKDTRQKTIYNIKVVSSTDRDVVEEASLQIGLVTWEKLKKLFMPSLLYQIGVITQGMGLRYTSASVNQMISGSCIIFTAIFSVIFLQRNLNWRHWAGLMLACIGICVVSMASLQIITPDLEIDEAGHVIMPAMPEFTPGQIAYGIFMTVFSQVVGAAQMVWEEAYITDLRLAPLQVMGYEGVWGLILDLALFMPLAALMPGPDVGGVEENSMDTAVMLYNNHAIRWVALFFFVSVAGTSQFGIIVSSRLGSLFRAVLLTARTALIWLMDLTVFYNNIGPSRIGEGWSHTSPVRAVGFMFLLSGTGIYARECMPSKRVDGEKRQGDKGRKLDSSSRKLDGGKSRSKIPNDIGVVLRIVKGATAPLKVLGDAAV